MVISLSLAPGCSDIRHPAASDSARAPGPETAGPDESARLTAWLDAQYRQELDFSPMEKTMQGDKHDYDKLDDVSEAALDRQLEWRRGSVAQLRDRFDYDKLDAEAQTSYDLWVHELEKSERAAPFRRHDFIFVRGGPQAELPNFLINFHRVETAADMEAYIARLRALEKIMGQFLDRARRAAADGIRPPRFNYDFALEEIGRIMTGSPFTSQGESPLWLDARTKADALQQAGTITPEATAAFKEAARKALLESVKPAYDAVQTWLQEDRANAPVDQVGAWTLPDGAAYYNTCLFLMTTQEMTADEIHAIGLGEVAHLRGEMEALKERVGFTGTLAEFFIFMREGKQFLFPNTDTGREAYLQLARDYLGSAQKKLPEYFGLLPKAGLEVRRVESFREQPGEAQHYFQGTPDGSRPGIFYAHLSDMEAMPRYELEFIAYHEGVPGHHMQISIAQELTDLPRFRTQSFHTAFIEGWALYAETLGKEMGFYTDPYSDFGRLTGEMWRAIRLVVDTGIHAKHWSEADAVRYFLDNSSAPEAAVRSEIQRYISMPGQATAYKIGMLKILDLRAKAQAALGDRFDIRGFHDTVLGGGALPLPMLESRVTRWVESQ